MRLILMKCAVNNAAEISCKCEGAKTEWKGVGVTEVVLEREVVEIGDRCGGLLIILLICMYAAVEIRVLLDRRAVVWWVC